jgi:hypothetical protein
VLALDADYLLTTTVIEELKHLQPTPDVSGYRANFRYCVNGRHLRGSAYPPVTVLYRLQGARYRQDGHAHRVIVEGRVVQLLSEILHDDRKSLSHWIRSQDKYMQLERKKLLETPVHDLGWADRIRRLRVVAPFAIFVYCLFIKGAILDGRAGVYYAFQRLLSELLLSLYLFEENLADENHPESINSVVYPEQQISYKANPK